MQQLSRSPLQELNAGSLAGSLSQDGLPPACTGTVSPATTWGQVQPAGSLAAAHGPVASGSPASVEHSPALLPATEAVRAYSHQPQHLQQQPSQQPSAPFGSPAITPPPVLPPVPASLKKKNAGATPGRMPAVSASTGLSPYKSNHTTTASPPLPALHSSTPFKLSPQPPPLNTLADEEAHNPSPPPAAAPDSVTLAATLPAASSPHLRDRSPAAASWPSPHNTAQRSLRPAASAVTSPFAATLSMVVDDLLASTPSGRHRALSRLGNPLASQSPQFAGPALEPTLALPPSCALHQVPSLEPTLLVPAQHQPSPQLTVAASASQPDLDSTSPLLPGLQPTRLALVPAGRPSTPEELTSPLGHLLVPAPLEEDPTLEALGLFSAMQQHQRQEEEELGLASPLSLELQQQPAMLEDTYMLTQQLMPHQQQQFCDRSSSEHQQQEEKEEDASGASPAALAHGRAFTTPTVSPSRRAALAVRASPQAPHTTAAMPAAAAEQCVAATQRGGQQQQQPGWAASAPGRLPGLVCGMRAGSGAPTPVGIRWSSAQQEDRSTLGGSEEGSEQPQQEQEDQGTAAPATGRGDSSQLGQRGGAAIGVGEGQGVCAVSPSVNGAAGQQLQQPAFSFDGPAAAECAAPVGSVASLQGKPVSLPAGEQQEAAGLAEKAGRGGPPPPLRDGRSMQTVVKGAARFPREASFSPLPLVGVVLNPITEDEGEGAQEKEEDGGEQQQQVGQAEGAGDEVAGDEGSQLTGSQAGEARVSALTPAAGGTGRSAEPLLLTAKQPARAPALAAEGRAATCGRATRASRPPLHHEGTQSTGKPRTCATAVRTTRGAAQLLLRGSPETTIAQLRFGTGAEEGEVAAAPAATAPTPAAVLQPALCATPSEEQQQQQAEGQEQDEAQGSGQAATPAFAAPRQPSLTAGRAATCGRTVRAPRPPLHHEGSQSAAKPRACDPAPRLDVPQQQKEEVGGSPASSPTAEESSVAQRGLDCALASTKQEILSMSQGTSEGEEPAAAPRAEAEADTSTAGRDAIEPPLPVQAEEKEGAAEPAPVQEQQLQPARSRVTRHSVVPAPASLPPTKGKRGASSKRTAKQQQQGTEEEQQEKEKEAQREAAALSQVVQREQLPVQAAETEVRPSKKQRKARLVSAKEQPTKEARTRSGRVHDVEAPATTAPLIAAEEPSQEQEPAAKRGKGKRGPGQGKAQREEAAECLREDSRHAWGTARSQPAPSLKAEAPVVGCQVCHRANKAASILLCDLCDLEWHMGCLQPPLSKVPKGKWACPKCEEAAAPFSKPPTAAKGKVAATRLVAEAEGQQQQGGRRVTRSARPLAQEASASEQQQQPEAATRVRGRKKQPETEREEPQPVTQSAVIPRGLPASKQSAKEADEKPACEAVVPELHGRSTRQSKHPAAPEQQQGKMASKTSDEEVEAPVPVSKRTRRGVA